MHRTIRDKFHLVLILLLCAGLIFPSLTVAADNDPSDTTATSGQTTESTPTSSKTSEPQVTEPVPSDSTTVPVEADPTDPESGQPDVTLPDTPPINDPDVPDENETVSEEDPQGPVERPRLPIESVVGFKWQVRAQYPPGFIFERYAPAVVGLMLDRRPGTPSHEMNPLLSGVTISRDGLVITTNHQVEDYYNEFNQPIGNVRIYAVRRGETRLREMELVFRDIAGDIAIFRMERDVYEIFPFIEFRNEGRLQIGDTVYSISFPDILDIEGGLSSGIITDIGPREVLEGGLTTQVITSNAYVTQSGCGGLMLNSHGEVVGMSTGRLTRSLSDRMCHFYRSDDLEAMIEMAEEGSEENRPESWLGVTLLNNEGYETLKAFYDFPDGVYVRSVFHDSPAYIADIQSGDIIRRINGRNVRSVKDFLIIMSGIAIGEEVQIDLLRPRVNLEREKRVYTVPYPIRN